MSNFSANYDLKHETLEEKAAIDSERSHRFEHVRQMQYVQAIAGIPEAFGDLTEYEVLALALMSSQEEEDERQLQHSLLCNIDNDNEYTQLDGDNDETSENGYTQTSSLASSANGKDRDSFSRDSLDSLASFSHLSSVEMSLGTSRQSSNSLLVTRSLQRRNASPRVLPSLPDDTAASDWPVPSLSDQSTSLPLSDDPSNLVTSPKSVHASITPIKWSEMAKRPAAPLSPELSPRITLNTRSLLTEQLENLQNLPESADLAAAEGMDHELRYALELSRVEELSRLAAQIDLGKREEDKFF